MAAALTRLFAPSRGRTWWITTLALWLLATPALRSAETSEPAAWQAEYARAVTQARREGKLLLVVHLSGPFVEDAADSPEAKLYRNYILGDPQVARLIHSRFVVAVRNVGIAACTPQVAAAAAKKPSAPEGKIIPPPPARPREMAVAYVCLPDERVLHFVPGFVNPDKLYAELAWVESAYAGVAAVPSTAWPDVWRRRHADAIDPADREAFASLFKSRWPAEESSTPATRTDELLGKSAPLAPSWSDAPPPEYAAADLADAMRASQIVWRFAQDQQSGKVRQFNLEAAREQARKTSPAANMLASHGSQGSNLAHLVLAEFPLMYLSDLAAPAYEACAGQRLWQTSLRRQELARWWSECRVNRRKTLLIVSPEFTEDELAKRGLSAVGDAKSPEPTASASKSPAARTVAAAGGDEPSDEFVDEIRRLTDEEAGYLAVVWRASHQTLSASEFAALVHDAGLQPEPYDVDDGFPRCILHDGHGFRCGELSLREVTAERLEMMLRANVGGAATGK
jgi:hypothetical protein